MLCFAFFLHLLIRETLLEKLSLIDLLRLKEARLPKVRDKMRFASGFRKDLEVYQNG